MKIYIESISDSNTFSIDIKSHERVIAMKNRITSISNIIQQAQILSYNGKILQNDKKLIDYGIQTGSTIALLIKSAPSNKKNSNVFTKHSNINTSHKKSNSQSLQVDTQPFIRNMTIYLFVICILSFFLKLYHLSVTI